ncbi:hypothetical protein EV385_6299 [Krasilnikovia cinnamomea]|uniref:Uncharacterized protein n=1 Tax=Krasilnikovia cinnamomea TaxID=349313 RepID=A0A4Q7ZT11_9ACTN|nr:hypothetical protein [Krasilnikovia cinnamomea]RZU54348.1 hypothetical protein EV385_6299 [Krasilnikovia cinnamomea]
MRPLARWPWWAVLRIAVVGLWVLAAATAWWTAPRQQSYAQARADVAAGRVTTYQWGDRWDGNTRRWFDDYGLQSSDTLGPLFAWRTPDGRWHWTDTTDFGEVMATGAALEKQYAGVGAAALAKELRDAGLDNALGDVGRPAIVTGIEASLGLLFIGVLVAGPAPRLGTRWYWFWLVTVAPYGLGMLFWMFRDHPWSRTTAAPGDEDQRDRGVRGLLLGILSAFVIGLVVLALQSLLGDRWVPQPR